MSVMSTFSVDSQRLVIDEEARDPWEPPSRRQEPDFHPFFAEILLKWKISLFFILRGYQGEYLKSIFVKYNQCMLKNEITEIFTQIDKIHLKDSKRAGSLQRGPVQTAL